MTCDEVLAFKDIGKRRKVSDTELIVLGFHLGQCESCRIFVQDIMRMTGRKKGELKILQRLNRRIQTDPELQYLKN